MDIPEEIAKEAERAEQEASAATEEPKPSFFTCVKCGQNKGRIRMPSHMCHECLAKELGHDSATSSQPNVVPVYAGPMPITSLDDLAQRLRMLMDSWAMQYEDGQLRIRFDTESRRQVEMAKVQTTAPLVTF